MWMNHLLDFAAFATRLFLNNTFCQSLFANDFA